jgi:RND family efflux transporter MFP subunit
VREGQPLVYLLDAQYREQIVQAQANFRVNQAALKQAQAQLGELQAQYRAIKTLAEEGLASHLEVETLEAQIASANARIELTEAQIQESQSAVKEARTILSKTVIRAPITGTVGDRNAEVGMQVASSTQLFTIGDLDRLRIEVVLAAKMLGSVKRGQPVRIYTGSKVLEARLSRLSPFLDRVSRTTMGEVDFRNGGDLKPGMSVMVEILYGQSQQSTLIPTSALHAKPNTGQEGVYCLPSFPGGPDAETRLALQSDPGRLAPISAPTQVEFLPVEVIAEGRMEVAVKGIDPGSWIVTVGQDLLSAGAVRARVRASNWERVLRLQGLQREDLLRDILQTE